MSPFLKALLATSLLANPLAALNCGNHGHLFPVVEEDLIECIRKKLAQVEWDTWEDLLQEKVVRLAKYPTPVQKLKEAMTYRCCLYDPSMVSSQDITDGRGKVIVPAGKKVNPLEMARLGDSLLFFDGSKQTHIDWALSQECPCKWILVKGCPVDLEEKYQRAVYFDQQGYLTDKLEITHVPAKVSQEGLNLKIEEIPAPISSTQHPGAVK